MMYELQWTIDAMRDLHILDSKTSDRITKKVSWFAKQSSPLRHAQPLVGVYKGRYRFRVGDYRVLFKIDHDGKLQILMILLVKHRRDVYR